MNSLQVIHYHYPQQLKYVSFIETSSVDNLLIDDINQSKFKDAYSKEIKPYLNTLLKYLEKNESELMINFSSSFLDSLNKQDPKLMSAIQGFVDSGKILLVGSCAFHSLSYLCNTELFKKEINIHNETYVEYFGKKASIFINTACLFGDQMIELLEEKSFKSVIAPANDWHLKAAGEAKSFQSVGNNSLNVILANGTTRNSQYAGLSNGYGSGYPTVQLSGLPIGSFENKLKKTNKSGTYSASIPLSSPEWNCPISKYLSNPFQKSLMNDCSELVQSLQSKLSDEDWQVLMHLVEPDNLNQVYKNNSSENFQSFVNSMNILTAIDLKYS